METKSRGVSMATTIMYLIQCVFPFSSLHFQVVNAHCFFFSSRCTTNSPMALLFNATKDCLVLYLYLYIN